MGYKLYFGLSLIALVVLFVFQNMIVVEIRFLFWSISMSRSLMIFLVFTVGLLQGGSSTVIPVTERERVH